MFLGPFKLFDIVNLVIKKFSRFVLISFDISESLSYFESNYHDIENNSLETCKNKNDRQWNYYTFL